MCTLYSVQYRKSSKQSNTVSLRTFKHTVSFRTGTTLHHIIPDNTI